MVLREDWNDMNVDENALLSDRSAHNRADDLHRNMGLVPISFLDKIYEDKTEDTTNDYTDSDANQCTHCFAIKQCDDVVGADIPAAVGDIFRLNPRLVPEPGKIMVTVPIKEEMAGGISERFITGTLPIDACELIPPEVTHVAAFEYLATASDELSLCPGDLLVVCEKKMRQDQDSDGAQR